jgi:hypothetical protein
LKRSSKQSIALNILLPLTGDFFFEEEWCQSWGLWTKESQSHTSVWIDHWFLAHPLLFQNKTLSNKTILIFTFPNWTQWHPTTNLGLTYWRKECKFVWVLVCFTKLYDKNNIHARAWEAQHFSFSH